MAKLKQDLDMYQGNKRTLGFTVEDEDAGDGSPLDITTWDIKWAASKYTPDKSSFSKTPTLEKKSSVGNVEIEKVDAVNGVLDVKIIGADSALTAGEYYHELELTDASGETVVGATGDLTVLRNITNT